MFWQHMKSHTARVPAERPADHCGPVNDDGMERRMDSLQEEGRSTCDGPTTSSNVHGEEIE